MRDTDVLLNHCGRVAMTFESEGNRNISYLLFIIFANSPMRILVEMKLKDMSFVFFAVSQWSETTGSSSKLPLHVLNQSHIS